MDRDLIAARLNWYAHWYAAYRTFRIADGAASHMQALTAAAADTMLKQGVEEYRLQAEVRTAEARLSVFVDAMIDFWQQSPDLQQRGNVIGERTFEWARKVLCPLPPFC